MCDKSKTKTIVHFKMNDKSFHSKNKVAYEIVLCWILL